MDPNISSIKNLIETYKTHIRETKMSDEVYKWQLVSTFKGRPDVNAIDFTKEYKSVKFGNLIYAMAIATGNFLVTERPQELRELFRNLFDETIPLNDRVKFFNTETLRIYKLIEGKHSHHQDERSISTYLTYHNPEKYTFYKSAFYKEFCKILDVKAAGKNEKYGHYLELINEFIETYLRKDDELISLVKGFIPEYFDSSNLLILAQDILYTTLDKKQEKPVAYWRIGTRDEEKNDFWPLMLEKGIICIGWYNLGDLNDSAIKNKTDVDNLLKERNNYVQDNRTRSRKAKEIFNFYKTAKDGDIVLAQFGSTVLGIGIITDDYNYDPENDFPHHREVEWIKIFSNGEFINNEGNQTTFVPLTDINLIQRIQSYLLNNVEQESNGNQINHTMQLNTILYGPPGTGKTYHTTNLALEICGIQSKELERVEAKQKFDELTQQGRIVFTTFHQSMSYEDFIEGIKPVEPDKEGDQVIYRVEDGIFKKLCVEAAFSIATEGESKHTETVLDFSLAYDELVEEIEEKFNEGLEFELDSKNGGKVLVDSISPNGNIVIKHQGGARTYTVSKQRCSRLHSEIDDLDSVNNIHDHFRAIIGGSNSSAYWSVLNAIQSKLSNITPQQKSDRKYSYDEKKEVIQTLRSEDFKNKSGKPYILVIDEINRGNVSQIFGELITLIEEDKRLGNEEAIQVTLPYSKVEKFGVPSNLYIIGTMNTADRSVEALDTALRRRFSFEEMPPKPELLKTPDVIKNEGIDLNILLTTINSRIEKLIDRDHRIGHSYFINVKNFGELQATFHNKIVPLLQEYFFGDHGKIGLVLGKGFVTEIENSNEDDLFAEFDYETDGLMQRKVYQLKNIGSLNVNEFIITVKGIHRN